MLPSSPPQCIPREVMHLKAANRAMTWPRRTSQAESPSPALPKQLGSVQPTVAPCDPQFLPLDSIVYFQTFRLFNFSYWVTTAQKIVTRKLAISREPSTWECKPWQEQKGGCEAMPQLFAARFQQLLKASLLLGWTEPPRNAVTFSGYLKGKKSFLASGFWVFRQKTYRISLGFFGTWLIFETSLGLLSLYPAKGSYMVLIVFG